MNRFFCAALFLLLSTPTPVRAALVTVPGVAGGTFNVQLTSMKEARFNTTIRQQYDFSCGSAALATLLTYHYQDPVSEGVVFKAMYDRGDKAKIQEYGFSLLDIKNTCKAGATPLMATRLHWTSLPPWASRQLY